MTGTKPVKLMWDDDIAISSVTLYLQTTKTKQNPTPKQKIAQNKVPTTEGKKNLPPLLTKGPLFWAVGWAGEMLFGWLSLCTAV